MRLAVLPALPSVGMAEEGRKMRAARPCGAVSSYPREEDGRITRGDACSGAVVGLLSLAPCGIPKPASGAGAAIVVIWAVLEDIVTR
eukprot:3838297-Pleurochrysis_carterae.AAC.1